jgi:hypothetical protein
MAGNEALRGEINAALCNPNFVAIAARLTGGFLRQVVANRLRQERIDVVVVAANSLGDAPPYGEADIMWQPQEGGDFVRQRIKWELAPWTFESRTDSSGAALIIDCERCGETNEIAMAGTATAGLRCSHCGADLHQDATRSLGQPIEFGKLQRKN